MSIGIHFIQNAQNCSDKYNICSPAISLDLIKYKLITIEFGTHQSICSGKHREGHTYEDCWRGGLPSICLPFQLLILHPVNKMYTLPFKWVCCIDFTHCNDFGDLMVS